MKKILTMAAALLMGLGAAHAQYWEIANQLPSLISPALQGGLNYKGYVELSGTAGIGSNRLNCVGISTSQGFKYADWFFMGVGIGVDVAHSTADDGGPSYYSGYYPEGVSPTKEYYTKCMIPVFTDFRFNIGAMNKTGFFIDLKLGAAWILGDGPVVLQHTYIGNNTQFFFKPQIGMRIPVNAEKPRRAFNIGLTYQLLTNNDNDYWGYSYESATLSNLGITLGYEW